MQRERGGQEGSNTSSNAFGGLREKISSLFGKSSSFGSIFGSSNSPPSKATPQHDSPLARRFDGPVIEELDSDDDGEVENNGEGDAWANKNPVVEHPEDLAYDHDESKKLRENVSLGTTEGTQSVSYKRVTYGGINGAYLTATTTRRTGSDGRVWEETKHADVTTGEATHRISRGIHDKGHTLTRKLKSDGKVDTAETLHNLEEDDLVGFDREWKCNVDEHRPGWKGGLDSHLDSAWNCNANNAGSSSNWLTNWDSPFREGFRGPRPDRDVMARPSGGRPKKVVTINIE